MCDAALGWCARLLVARTGPFTSRLDAALLAPSRARAVSTHTSNMENLRV